MSATLGGLIKDLRLQKNISQLEVAFALGWKEPARLSRIEQGKVGNPTRELLEKIMIAMHLTPEERNQLLLIGNYLPSKEEIELTRKRIGPIVDNWQFPATLLDFSWRIIYTNEKMYRLHRISKKQQEQIEDFLPNILEMSFVQDLAINSQQDSDVEKQRHEFLIRTLMHFQYAQKDRSRSKWYQDLITKMMDNKLFRELWVESQKTTLGQDIMNFSRKTIVINKGKRMKFLNFNFFMVPVFGDPRFSVEFYTPADRETFAYFK